MQGAGREWEADEEVEVVGGWLLARVAQVCHPDSATAQDRARWKHRRMNVKSLACVSAPVLPLARGLAPPLRRVAPGRRPGRSAWERQTGGVLVNDRSPYLHYLEWETM